VVSSDPPCAQRPKYGPHSDSRNEPLRKHVRRIGNRSETLLPVCCRHCWIGQNRLMGQPLKVIRCQVTASADPRRTCVYYIRASCLSDALIVNIRVSICSVPLWKTTSCLLSAWWNMPSHETRLALSFLTDSQRKRRTSCTLEISSRSEKSWNNNFLSCEC